MRAFNLSVIISTYNHPIWLEKVLWGYECQSLKKFEIIIADDGSSIETKQLIDKMQMVVSYPIKHVWHEDIGFRKTVILNKATLASKSDYLVYTDGDCVPRKDFLQTHINHRQKGYFLSGGYFKLPMGISQVITKYDIEQQHCFDAAWLIDKGLKKSFKINKITASGLKSKLLNKLTPTTATWNGHNASGWKADIIKVNGYDERMQYGGEDRELGERLFNMGIKAKQIRYSAICIHLDHERGYVKPEMMKKNNKIRKVTKSNKVIKTPYGIKKDSVK